MIWMGKGAKCLKLVFSKLKINLEENSKLETKGILSCHVRSWATCEGFLSWLVIAFKARLENEIPEGVQIHCCQWWNGRIYKEECHVPASQWLLHGWIRSCCGHQRNQSKDCGKGSPLQTFPARTYGGSFQFFFKVAKAAVIWMPANGFWMHTKEQTAPLIPEIRCNHICESQSSKSQ